MCYPAMDEIMRPIEDFCGPKSEKLNSGIGQVPPSAIRAIGLIFAEGEEKYGRDNWKSGAGNPTYQAERLEHAESHLLEFKEMFMDEQYLDKKYPSVFKKRLLAKVAWFCVTQIELMRLEVLHDNEIANSMDEVANFHEKQAEEARYLSRNRKSPNRD